MRVYSFSNNKQTEVPLKAHVVFDATSGKIVHRHWTMASDARPLDKEKLLGMVRAELRVPKMDVLTVDGKAMQRGKKYHVDTEERALREAE